MMTRAGMYKNWRVGKVKYVTSAKGSKTKWLLLEVVEFCFGHDGKPYEVIPSYNLWITVDTDKFKLNKSDAHNWCVVGFYIQAFRDLQKTESYDNVLTLKELQWLADENEAFKKAKIINKSILNI